MDELLFCAAPILIIIIIVMIAAAVMRLSALRQDVDGLTKHLDRLDERVAQLEWQIGDNTAIRSTSQKPVSSPAVEAPKEEFRQVAPTFVSRPQVPVVPPPVEVPAPPVTEKPQQDVSPQPDLIAQARDAIRDWEWWDKFEENIGKRWMAWGGGLVVFLAVAFGVKLGIEAGLLGPAARMTLSVIFGIILLGAGIHFHRKKMPALGQGLLGGGLAVLYVSIFGAFAFYHLIPQPVAFGSLVIVTVVGMTLAVTFDAIAISFLATLGGFLTPVMVSTGQNARDVLLAYVLLLDLGVLGVAFFKRWRALDVLAFVGTAILFAGWFAKFYSDSQMVPVLAWLIGFYALFLILPFINHLRTATPATLERFIMALSNAVLVFVCGYLMLHESHRHILGLLSLGLSASYLVMGTIFRRRIPADVNSLFAFIALATTFLTISIPLHLGLNGITLAWAAEAPILLYLGYRFSYYPVRIFAFLVLFLLLLRLLIVHMPIHAASAVFMPIWNRDFGTALAVPIGMAVYSLIHHLHRRVASQDDRTLKVLVALASGFLTLVLLHMELGQWFGAKAREWAMQPDYLVWSALAILWTVGGVAFVASGILVRNPAPRIVGLAPLAIAGYFACRLYTMPWGSLAFLSNLRFEADILWAAGIFVSAFLLRRLGQKSGTEEQNLGIAIFTAFGFILPGILTAEIHQYTSLIDQTYYGSCALVALWALTGLAFLAAGVRGNVPLYRGIGLVPVAIACVLATEIYARDLDFSYRLFLNLRFGVVLLAVLVIFIYAHVLQRFAHLLRLAEQALITILFTVAGLFMLLLLTTEVHHFASVVNQRYYGHCSLIVLWSLGALAYLAAGVSNRSSVYRFFGLAPLMVAVILAVGLYHTDPTFSYRLLFNSRFGVELFAAISVLVYAVILGRLQSETQNEKAIGRFLLAGGVFLLLLLLSVEPFRYWMLTVRNPQKARWLAQMSLSVVWTLYATAILAVGFWRRIRNLRLASLGLYGLTAVKLVLVDMASVQQIYRIISFFVLGLFMIGASYLYHHLEKRLTVR